MICRLLVIRIKSIFLSLWRFFMRLLCIFKRKRRPSGEAVDMENVVVLKDHHSSTANGNSSENFVPWNAWDTNNEKRDLTTEDYIQKYRQSLAKVRAAENEETGDLNLFEDMEPQIRVKSTSISSLLPKRPAHQKVNFAVQDNFSNTLDTELGDLEEGENLESQPGWEADENLDIVLKQHKIEERRKRTEEQIKRKEQRQTKVHKN